MLLTTQPKIDYAIVEGSKCCLEECRDILDSSSVIHLIENLAYSLGHIDVR